MLAQEGLCFSCKYNNKKQTNERLNKISKVGRLATMRDSAALPGRRATHLTWKIFI